MFMRRQHVKRRRSLALIPLVGVLGLASYALAASNTFSGSAGGAAGDGSGSISGYTVGAPAYTLLSGDPTKISSFAFTMSPLTASTAVKAGVVSGTLVACSVGTITSGSATVTCSYGSGSEPLVSAATSLSVVGVN